MNSPKVNRRTVLKGLGTAIALPWLETLASAAEKSTSIAAIPPKRIGFMYVPNGINMDHWRPKSVGKLDAMPETLKSLEAFKSDLNIISGMTLDKARANGDGGGDHARAMSSFLTGRQARKTHGADIRSGISADQHIANVIGEQTRFPSLELGIERGQMAGNCDSGYSCAYSSNLSWRGESTPNAKETDPKLVFDRLFAGSDPKELAAARSKRELYNRSVLDFVREDASSLNKTLSSTDKSKLDEYMTAIREIENRIERMKKAALERKPVAKPNLTMPATIPGEFQDHARLMLDLMVLSYQTDLTRIVTLPLANDGSGRSYKSIGVPEGHHDLSHHGRNEAKLEKLKKINIYHVEQVAYLMSKLKGIKEANGTTLLDNVLLVYGSGISDGDRHNHDDLPILLLGKGGGAVQTGRHLKYANETPLMNLYLALFEIMGAPASRFGDSTGKLSL